jgi:catechol 2,3-dioxygenase-like lactoylglutathione lyase family enzyme
VSTVSSKSLRDRAATRHRPDRAGTRNRDETMTDLSSPAPTDHGVRFGRMAPGILVRDMAQALAFYRDILGFTKTFENGDPVGFMILKRDAAELHLNLQRDHKAGLHNVAHLMVEDVDALHARCQANGVRIIKGLRDKDFGLRAFVFADPDGNRIDVGQRL